MTIKVVEEWIRKNIDLPLDMIEGMEETAGATVFEDAIAPFQNADTPSVDNVL